MCQHFKFICILYFYICDNIGVCGRLHASVRVRLRACVRACAASQIPHRARAACAARVRQPPANDKHPGHRPAPERLKKGAGPGPPGVRPERLRTPRMAVLLARRSSGEQCVCVYVCMCVSVGRWNRPSSVAGKGPKPGATAAAPAEAGSGEAGAGPPAARR